MAYLPLNSVRNITNATAKLGGLAFDGVTNAKDLHTLTTDIGTSDCSVVVTFQCPSTNPSTAYGIAVISSSSTTYNVARSIYIDIESSGQLICYLNGSAAGYARLLTLTGFVSSYGGRLVNIVFAKSSSGNTAKLYVNGVDSGATESTAGASPPAWTDTVISTYAYFGQLSSSYLLNTPIFGAWVFNRALSASEVVTLANQGVQEADKWGSLTAKIGGTTNNGNFEAGAGTTFTSWGVSGTTTITVAEETVDMHSGTRCPKITGGGAIASSGNNWFACNSNTDGPLVHGKRYRYSVWLKRVSGTDSAQLGTGYTEFAAITNAGAWQEYTGSFVANSTITTSSDVLTFGAASGSVWLIDDVTITQIGSILDAEFPGVGYQVPDRSSNNYHGLISTSGTSWTLPRKTGQAIYTIAASGYLGDGTSRAIIPDNARIDNIQAYSTSGSTFSIGDDSGSPTNVIGSTAISAATLTDLGTPAKRFLTTGTNGRLYVTFSAANSTVFTINYSLAPTS